MGNQVTISASYYSY